MATSSAQTCYLTSTNPTFPTSPSLPLSLSPHQSHSNPPWGLQYDATMQPFSVFSRRPDMILHRPFSELIESRRRPAAKEEEPTDEEWLRKLRKRQQQAAQQVRAEAPSSR